MELKKSDTLKIKGGASGSVWSFWLSLGPGPGDISSGERDMRDQDTAHYPLESIYLILTRIVYFKSGITGHCV